MITMDDIATTERVFSVSEYIGAINNVLKKFKVRVVGEITEIKNRGHIWFSIKDKNDGAVLNCVIWQSNYEMCGIELQEGLEVILSGYADIYKPSGFLSFKAETIELKGEGALKKVYEALKRKLDSEGIFAAERKKPLPEFPQKIGVITSRQGAVIHDLLSNLGKFGFHVKMIDSRVEGQEAIKDLLGAAAVFRKQEIDILLIIRGGGSLESLQAFNNEMLVRAIVDFPVPIIAAIGHDKDIPLLALAADFVCSTPTAAANVLNKTWETAPLKINQRERIIFETFNRQISRIKNDLWKYFTGISGWFGGFFSEYKKYESYLSAYILRIGQGIISQKNFLDICWQKTKSCFSVGLREASQKLNFISRAVKANDPQNNLALGYCLARKNGRVIRTVQDVKIGENIDLQVKDGMVRSTINTIHPIK